MLVRLFPQEIDAAKWRTNSHSIKTAYWAGALSVPTALFRCLILV